MTSAQNLNYARRYLQKAEEYLASAHDNFDLDRTTPAAGDAIHAGINAKDAIVMTLTGNTGKAKDHAKSARELGIALGARPEAATAEKALRELVSMKAEVEYGVAILGLSKVEPLLRRAQTLTDLANRIVRQGR